uniref:Lysine-rich matrix protein 8 n=1 Tax=Pinctada fucata TaxID=50426 RepID=A0A1B0UKN9_PINFU|nr:lysine-rich matrix protein 8 [Pinctada fucata]
MKAAAILAVVLLIGVLSVQGDWKKPPFNKCWWKLKWCLKKCHIWPFPWNCQKLCYWKYKKCIWLGGHHFGGGYGDYGPGLGDGMSALGGGGGGSFGGGAGGRGGYLRGGGGGGVYFGGGGGGGGFFFGGGAGGGGGVGGLMGGGLGDGGMGGGGMSGGGGFDGYDDDDSYGGYGWHRPIHRKKKY